MERLRLGPALLEGVLARLGLAVQLVLAFFVIFLVAPDLTALLHLRAAAGDECEERGEAAHHVWGVRATRARRSDSRAVRRAAHHHPCWWSRPAAVRPSRLWWRSAVLLRVLRVQRGLGLPLARTDLRSQFYLADCKALEQALFFGSRARLIHLPSKRWDVIIRSLSTHIVGSQIFRRGSALTT